MLQCSRLIGKLSSEKEIAHVSVDNETFYKVTAYFNDIPLSLLVSEYILDKVPVGVPVYIHGYLVPSKVKGELLFYAYKIYKSEREREKDSCVIEVCGTLVYSHHTLSRNNARCRTDLRVSSLTPNGRVTTCMTAEERIARSLANRETGKYIHCVCELKKSSRGVGLQVIDTK